ncbi:peptidylamidoglycolate lyase [Catalinimonas alkaloidigena]|uniref:6-bladed beta-propeller n=1 Tax=Catalinimonas alkaloidigena TaxID=1075417 RepID=UPI0024073959|nr:6-bladed beta-propeller [Catalinimonas alkaloidigena]MDF9796415.1 peptidylamidoglycolate lyase [Catalinimonas alkaloidigena]
MESKSRREFIKNTTALVSSSFLLPEHVFNIVSSPKLSKNIIGHGDFQYRADLSWGNLNPSKTPVNDCHEMVQDKNGRIFLLTNETKNNVIIYDLSGKLMKTWGHDFAGAHGLTLNDEGGEEFLYITDIASHAVYKTTLEGKVLLKLAFPKALEGQYNSEKYYPTETAIAANGDIYVADGYGTQLILQYDAQGMFLRKFGGMGWLWKELLENRYPDKIQWENEPEQVDPSLLNNAHGITLDRRKKKPELLVTSRMDNMIKRFTLDGKFIANIEIPGAFVCRAVVDEQYMYAAVLRSDRPSRDETGFVTILNNDDHVISNPGGSPPVYRGSKLVQIEQQEKLFKHPHDVCIDNDKNLYIPQWNANKVYPIKLVRV